MTTPLTPKWPTIVEAIQALEGCDRYGARFVGRGGEATFYPYRVVLERARAAAGALTARGLRPGDRVAIILPTGIEFMDSFLGTQLAGGVPAALYPPVRLGKLDEYFKRTRRMIERIGARLLVTNGRVKQVLGPVAADSATLEQVVDAESLQAGGPWTPATPTADDPAFLQFSSGTTADPKAVVMTHRALLHNLAMIDEVFRGNTDEEAERGGVCWLPLYHDMGLLGNLYQGLYHPGTVTYLGPEQFIARPALWLQTMSKYRALISAAPNFAYGYCTTRIRTEEMQGVDLSHWQLAFNGAEAIDTNVMAKFVERFKAWGFRPEAMTPVYGLAEAGLAVTFSNPLRPALVTEFDREALGVRRRAQPGLGRRLACVGRAMAGLQVEVHDPPGTRVPHGHVGTVMVKGPSLTPGYYNDPELTARAFCGEWLDTGDLGFVHEGELYIAGRKKDLIIIRGRNCAPQEIEELLAGVDGLRTGCVVALGHVVEGQGEELILLAERDPRSERDAAAVIAEMRERVLGGVGIMPYRIELLDPGTLPRTSSGKMRRAEALQMYLSSALTPPKQVGALQIASAMAKSRVGWARFWWRGLGR